MKITTWTFAIGTLALCGIFPFAGFWSKDSILAAAYHEHMGLFLVGLIAAFFTAFYMSRLFFLVFLGKPRFKSEAHESPTSMSVPLVVLAVLAVVAGFVFTPFNPWLGSWLTGKTVHEEANITVMLLSNIAGLAGIGVGWLMYSKRSVPTDLVSGPAPGLYRLVHHNYFIDELYRAVIVKPLQGIGSLLNWFDKWIIDGLVRLSILSAVGLGKVGIRVQNGQVQTYGLVTLLGLIVLMLALAGRRFI